MRVLLLIINIFIINNHLLFFQTSHYYYYSIIIRIRTWRNLFFLSFFKCMKEISRMSRCLQPICCTKYIKDKIEFFSWKIKLIFTFRVEESSWLQKSILLVSALYSTFGYDGSIKVSFSKYFGMILHFVTFVKMKVFWRIVKLFCKIEF